MLAVRSVLDDMAKPLDEGTRKAAVALYMLCACRWVKDLPAPQVGRVIRVPFMVHNSIAVLSAALLGGEVWIEEGEGRPRVANTFHVRAPVGESPSTNLLRAIHASLYIADPMALDVARHDETDEETIDRLLADVKARLRTIRRQKKSSLTVIVDSPDAFENAGWASEIDLQPFCVDNQLARNLFVLSPNELDAEIRELWRQISGESSTRT
jgi:hypothetical protein